MKRKTKAERQFEKLVQFQVQFGLSDENLNPIEDKEK